MLQADSERAERLPDEVQLLLRFYGPSRVVLDDADGGVKAIIQRGMARQLAVARNLRFCAAVHRRDDSWQASRGA